jgi:hypothetical protein
MACLFVSAKSHDLVTPHTSKRLIDQIVGAFIHTRVKQQMKHGQKVMSDEEKQKNQARSVGRVLDNEYHVLQAIEFEFEQPSPYDILETCMLKLFRDHASQPRSFLERLSQKGGFLTTAWGFITDSLSTSLYTQVSTVAVVVATIHLALGLPKFKSIADTLALTTAPSFDQGLLSAVKSIGLKREAVETEAGEIEAGEIEEAVKSEDAWYKLLFGVDQDVLENACEQILLVTRKTLSGNASSSSASLSSRASPPSNTMAGDSVKRRAEGDANDEIERKKRAS